jgi:hypothetical protein
MRGVPYKGTPENCIVTGIPDQVKRTQVKCLREKTLKQ